MSRQASSRGGRGPSDESIHPYNLFDKHPSQSNDRGQMYEATSNEYHQLRVLDIDVS
ncbi:hypothetical protein QJS10_CPA06g00648 [Acorus calamus]|uniref:Uncharacterized protein n=1 Tax=Acorus calamus TaxID=4465 RepID=A0AAV9EQ82_ACOCL|nr:hypothetical protein QJS10_CPA06g00648 [Acorus calamus]